MLNIHVNNGSNGWILRASLFASIERLEGDEERWSLQHENPPLPALIVAALSIACRSGELLSSQWKQIRCNNKGDARWSVLPASKIKTYENRSIPVSSVYGLCWKCIVPIQMLTHCPQCVCIWQSRRGAAGEHGKCLAEHLFAWLGTTI